MKSLRGTFRFVGRVVLAYVVLEGGFRFYRYERLKSSVDEQIHYSFSSFKAPLYTVDAEAGYAYQPNARNHQWLYDKDNDLVPHDSEIATNNMGMFGSSTDIQAAKGPDEFRIAVLGDSFCATTTSTVPWPTALERVFSTDSDFKRLVGQSTIRVLNFGLDGTGIVQWPAVYRTRAAKFDPDFVIVNFIGDDILRRFLYRDTLQFGDAGYGMFACTSLPVTIANPTCRNGLAFVIDPTREDYRQRAIEIKRRIYEALLQQLPWYSLNPELLAAISKGHLGLHSKLQWAKSSTPHYDTEDQAMRASLEALTQLTSVPHSTLLLHHPVVQECLAHKSDPLVQKFIQAASQEHIVDMTGEMPPGASADEINKWYNGPYDWHPSSYGAQIYAEIVAKQIRAAISAELSAKARAKTK
ncbi:MAG: SGNH/GDSL hydrolase family protein [Candidatus Acidiferrales bacterium]|jgi:hypothetical protein